MISDSNTLSIDEQLTALETATASPDFETAHAALTAAVHLLESPGIGLNQSLRAYELGRTLADQCQALLDAAELRITQLDGETDRSSL